ncbi:MAG TPA: AAA family ATPase [Flavisolibacter sp.]|jgi:predicted ATPase
MKEKLIIKNFGPIRHVELELGRFNVLIGEQATGKSTVAKLWIAIQNTIYRDLFDIPDEPEEDRHTRLFFEHLKLVGIHSYYNSNTEIRHITEKFKFELKDQSVGFTEKFKVDLKGQNVSSEEKNSIKEALSYNFNYIPSERGLAITVSDSLFAIMQTETALPKLFLRFGDKFLKARKEEEEFNYSSILGINYTYRDSKDIVILPDRKEISVHESSSGIQGAISLLTVFDYVSKKEARNNPLVIEEPELNCFPGTQNKLIKHIVKTNAVYAEARSKDYKNKILMTTHSPYVLTSLNNLMYAYKVGITHKEEAREIVEEDYWLNPEDVSAYMMLPDGTCEDIIDPEEGLIKAGRIDAISGVLNKEFDALLNLEFAGNEPDTR